MKFTRKGYLELHGPNGFISRHTEITEAFERAARSGPGTYRIKQPEIEVSILSRTIFDPDITAPSVPLGVSAQALSTSSIRFSWNAALDIGGSGLAGYRVYRSTSLLGTYTQVGSDFSVASLTYDDTGLSASTTYYYKVRAFDGNNNQSALSLAASATTQAAPVISLWPVQASGGAVHALPGINLWGSDSYGGSGRHPSSTGVNTYIVTSLAATNTGSAQGSNTYHGTLEYAMRHNAGTRSKQIILAAGGVALTNKQISSAGGMTSIWGQFAPGPGYFVRGGVLNSGGNDHYQVWHLPVYVGDDTPVPPDEGDGWKTGDGTNRYLFFVNCEFMWTMDEAFDAYRSFDRLGFIYCAFGEGLHSPELPDDRVAYGPLLGAAGGESFRVSIERSLFANTVDRNPWIGTRWSTIANNLNYNHGRIPVGRGVAANYNNQYGHTQPCLHNLAHGMIVRGPDCSNDMVGAKAIDSWSFPSGSGVHITGMANSGWSNVNQSAYLRETTTGFSYLASPQAAALPSGRSATFSDVYRIAAGANATAAERLAFATLMSQSVGANPGARIASAGRMSAIFTQIVTAMGGTTQGLQIRTGMTTGSNPVGSWFTAPEATVSNPLSPGSAWHAPLPNGDGVHTPYTSGAFSNGMSRAGYTPREVWAIEQHWFKGGK